MGYRRTWYCGGRTQSEAFSLFSSFQQYQGLAGMELTFFIAAHIVTVKKAFLLEWM